MRVIDDRTLCIPDYDGNGMYRTWGNVLVNPHVGLLFVDFEHPSRLRVNGRATINEYDALRDAFPGSVFIVRLTADRIPVLAGERTTDRWEALFSVVGKHGQGAPAEDVSRDHDRHLDEIYRDWPSS